ncbi:hypothetical protein [Polyangium mundeleinium]|uniref:Uncharacterized protein n=1 Tax=Polyangium mundeleinium TaxID=2995306 RepID=A0ABT5EVA0_9BACT|nr:hypothetical protein [Polyangium mundeleinium]MDC0745760.1 hypothetical protein [Polyangium mundeleinium]
MKRRISHSPLGGLALAALGLPLALVSSGGCQTQTVPTAVRALERSGRVSFLCLGAPGVGTTPALPFERCSGTRFATPDAYAVANGVTTQPHLYALVTQTTRGEVAVVDMSTKVDAVLDSNPRVPGANFLPIGAQPVDIVSTNGSMAAFVGVAEPGRAGIFALAAKDIRVCDTCAPKSLSSWPACALPGAPGEMLVVYDPKNDADEVRARCDDTTFAKPRDPEPDGAGGYLVDLTQEGLGRPKLVVTIPDQGALAVIDAQTLFDVEREADGTPKKDPETGAFVYVHAPGSWKECPIDRWVPLTVDLPVQSPPASPPTGAACVAPPVTPPAPAQAYDARPAGITLSEERLFVGDIDAPVVHVLDMKTPCEPIEREPLLPTSLREPARVVTTSQIAASPTLAGSLDRFLYAVDDLDGSVMVFDIAEDATSRRPVTRPHPEWTPGQAPDRVEFGVPVQDLVIIERDNPQPIPSTGVAPEGVRCNPDPDLTVCTSTATSCDPETLYRTSGTYESGAGPTRMRGAFAYVVLGTGQIAIVDIDDYDAFCRAPTKYTYLYGCPPPGAPAGLADEDALASTGEVSCNVVVPHTPRSANYMRTSERTGQNQPGLSGFPLLYNNQGTLQATFDLDAPLLRATVPAPKDASETIPPVHFTLAVGGTLRVIDQKTGLTTNSGDLEHTVAMNLEDPRAQSTSQTFTITYEGALPGFAGKAARLDLTGGPVASLSDAASRFCDSGVLGQRAWEEILASEGDANAAANAKSFADYVQIGSNIPAEDDIHWKSPETQGVCTFQQCKATFGPAELPRQARDITIVEAYQDRLELGASRGGAAPELIECCFPTLVGFNVRVGGQWAVTGNASGFLHHVISTPESVGTTPLGACRNSCDPTLARQNGRVRAVPHGTVVKDGDPLAFINPFFRMAINDPAPDNEFDSVPDDKSTMADDARAAAINAPPRDTFFQFATQGSFRPLILNLASATTEIQPQAVTFVPSTGELAITDGSLEGLILLSASRLDITRQYY